MFENEQFGTITRLTSVSLRHGTPLKFICEQLVRDGGLDKNLIAYIQNPCYFLSPGACECYSIID